MAVRVGDTLKPMNDLNFWVAEAENIGVNIGDNEKSLHEVLTQYLTTLNSLVPLLDEIKGLILNGGPSEEIVAKLDEAILDVAKLG